MAAEVGEQFVGAYLRMVLGCPVIQYNVRDAVPPISDETARAPKSQAEIDVLGMDYTQKRVYVCEVITHLGGALYSSKASGKSRDETVARLGRKLATHRRFAERAFPGFATVFMIWSPYVAAGARVNGMRELVRTTANLQLRINEEYAAAVRELMDRASADDGHTAEPFYRMCQLLTHLRGASNRRIRVRVE